jgi:Mrp family chromosome partitioning ATPase
MSTSAFDNQFPVQVRKEMLDHARKTGLSLLGMFTDQPTYVLGVTSALRGEGKTTFSLALSEVMAADFGLNVLWLDAHAERPLATMMANEDLPERGLSEWLSQQCCFEEVIVTAHEGRVLLPFGSRPMTSRDVLQYLVKAEAIQQLRSRYSLILLDLPDLQNSAGAALANLCDGIVLMIRAGDTPVDVVRKFMPLLENVKIHGVILNHHRSSVPARIRRLFTYYG